MTGDANAQRRVQVLHRYGYACMALILAVLICAAHLESGWTGSIAATLAR